MLNIYVYNSNGVCTYSHLGDGGRVDFDPSGGVRATIYTDNPPPGEPPKIEVYATTGYLVIIESDRVKGKSSE